jgi:hypothetical protein
MSGSTFHGASAGTPPNYGGNNRRYPPPPRGGGPRPPYQQHHQYQSQQQLPPAARPDRALGPLNEGFKFFLAHLPVEATVADIRQYFEVRIQNIGEALLDFL